jgi:hypothetical protein
MDTPFNVGDRVIKLKIPKKRKVTGTVINVFPSGENRVPRAYVSWDNGRTGWVNVELIKHLI